MVSTFTPNINLEEPARGDQVGTWDTPVNSNMTVLDLVVGAVATIPVAGAPIVLSGAQFQSKTLIFNSTLTASIAVTFSSTFTKSYEIFNQTTGSSAFIITLQTTAAGGKVICCPPGEFFEVANVAGSLFYKNMDRVGTYWDYAGSSVPAWVSGCTVPPYLACTGGTFSSATYPQLVVVLGSTTLPDSQGRARFSLDGGTARLSSAVAGFNPNTVGNAGGSQNPQQHNHNVFITDPGHVHTPGGGNVIGTQNQTPGGGGATLSPSNSATLTINSAVTGVTATSSNSGTGTAGNIPPAYVGGITLIRAA